MGLCESSENRVATTTSKKIDKELKRQPGGLKQKLLLLGPGESGKSTTLKQMQLLHSDGFSDEEIAEKKLIVFHNTITNMIVLLDALDFLALRLGDPSLKEQAGYLRKFVADTPDAKWFTPELKTAIKSLWADKGIQQCYQQRSQFQFTDSASFFFEHIDRIARADYKPDSQDILHTRVATTGVVQVNFNINNIDFEVYDVGGQRSERRKWIHCFDDVNAIIFVVAISEYDQTLREDSKTNRLTEAIELYDGIISARFFEKSSIILFLNKKDLFADKITRVSLGVCFPTYKGGLTYEDGLKHIKKEFRKLNKTERKVYVHETCATDTTQVKVVINSVIDTIIQENLRDTGMI